MCLSKMSTCRSSGLPKLTITYSVNVPLDQLLLFPMKLGLSIALASTAMLVSPVMMTKRLGWMEIFDNGLLVRLRGKTGWREVEIGRGSSDHLSRRRRRNLDQVRQARQRLPLLSRDWQGEGRRPQPPERPGGSAPRQEDGAGGRHPR